MLTLALDSSAGPASAAVIKDGRLLGEFFSNTKQTHSLTLLPMVENLMKTVGKTCADFDLLAVSNGPGSFTGVRIGVSCVKGMAMPFETPCCGVSTLEAIAWRGRACEGSILCAVMDARCGQVYNAMFRVENGRLLRLTEDRAIPVEELETECSHYGDSLLLLGDGAVLCYKSFQAWGARLAPEEIRYQRASCVAFAAEAMAKDGKTVPPAELVPAYLRRPQAERELKRKQERKGNEK